MWTQTSPQNSHRIWRQAPQGAASRGESATTAMASKLAQPLGDGLEDGHALGAHA